MSYSVFTFRSSIFAGRASPKPVQYLCIIVSPGSSRGHACLCFPVSFRSQFLKSKGSNKDIHISTETIYWHIYGLNQQKEKKQFCSNVWGSPAPSSSPYKDLCIQLEHGISTKSTYFQLNSYLNFPRVIQIYLLWVKQSTEFSKSSLPLKKCSRLLFYQDRKPHTV